MGRTSTRWGGINLTDNAGTPNNMFQIYPDDADLGGTKMLLSDAGTAKITLDTDPVALTFATASTVSTSTGALTIDGDDGIVLQTTGSGNVEVEETLDLKDNTLDNIGHADSVWDSSGLRVGGTNGWAIGNQTSVQRISNNSGTFSMLTSANAWANVEMAALQVNGAISMYNSGTLSLTGPVSVTGDTSFLGASYNLIWDASDNALEFADGAVAKFGTSVDMTIGHSSNTNTITLSNALTVTGSDTGFGTAPASGTGKGRVHIDGNGDFALLVGSGTLEGTARNESIGFLEANNGTGGSAIRWYDGSGNVKAQIYGSITTTTYVTPLHMYSSGNIALLPSGTGVGIGTTTPDYLLDIHSSTAGLRVKNDSGNTYLNLDSSADVYLQFRKSGTAKWAFITDYAGTDTMALYNYNNSSTNMSIGTNGTWYFYNNSVYDIGHADSYWSNDGAKFASANVGAKVYITSSATNSYPSIRMVNDVQEWRIYAPDGSIAGDAFHIYDATNSKYRLTAGTGGEIGFNTPTFDSWLTTAGSGYTPVFLGSKSSSIHGTNYDTAGSWTGWQQNAYIDSGSGVWEYVTTGAGTSNIWQYNGNIYFRTAASGTADTAISWSVPLQIGTSGVTLNNFALYDVGNAVNEWTGSGLKMIGNLWVTDNGTETLTMSHTGTVGLIEASYFSGSYTPITFKTSGAEAMRIDTVGDTYTNDGTIHSLSDSRLKKEVATLNDGLSIINQLRPVTYKYNGMAEGASDDNVVRYGLVADEVQAVASQYVKTRTAELSGTEVDDLKTLSTTNMIPMLIKAIQELAERVETLES